MRRAPSVKIPTGLNPAVEAECLCGAVRMEMDFPARWAWHDHSAASHIAVEETPEWAYLGESLVPLKGFPGVVWERSRRKKQPHFSGLF